MRSYITRPIMIGLVGWIWYHLYLILRYERVTIYESRQWLLIVELVVVAGLIVLRIESYIRSILRRH